MAYYIGTLNIVHRWLNRYRTACVPWEVTFSSVESETPLSHRPKQIHPKQIPKQKRCRNRRPQANKTLKTSSPSTPLEKFIPKQKGIKSPNKHRKSYVHKHWLITPQAKPKQTPSKPQGIRSDPVIKGAGYANRCA